jgi:hypothetical protein
MFSVSLGVLLNFLAEIQLGAKQQENHSLTLHWKL